MSQEAPGDLLRRTVKYLERKGHLFKAYKTDAYGAYAAGMLTPDSHLPYLLVVKTSTLGPDIVSFHNEILYAWHGPIVMGIGGSREGLPEEYFVFHPEIISRKRVGENKPWINQRDAYPDVDMINFTRLLGSPWSPDAGVLLETVWEQLKKRNAVESKERLDYYPPA